MSNEMMTTDEIVNVFCNMQGVKMNDIQRAALSSLIQTVFESGATKAIDKVEESLEAMPVTEIEDVGARCEGCQCSSLDLQLKDIPHLGGAGTYCQTCRKTYKDTSTDNQAPTSLLKCDGCKLTHTSLERDTLKYFGGLGDYCEYCIQANIDKLRAERA